jgi:hypothetical protein
MKIFIFLPFLQTFYREKSIQIINILHIMYDIYNLQITIYVSYLQVFIFDSIYYY